MGAKELNLKPEREKKMAIKLGDRVKDKVTGFEGIAIGRTQWFTGCDTIGITPTILKDGKTIDAEWFDINRIKKVEEKTTEVTPPGEGVG